MRSRHRLWTGEMRTESRVSALEIRGISSAKKRDRSASEVGGR